MTASYQTVLADPPWDIQQRGSPSRCAVQHYPVKSVDNIARLPVTKLAADNAHLWLWVTNASLVAGRQVMQAWGFSYRGILTWSEADFGLGQFLRTQTEHLLLGARNNTPIQFRGQGSWFYAPWREHSHKPEEQDAIIERCSPGPYLELFALRRRTGSGAQPQARGTVRRHRAT